MWVMEKFKQYNRHALEDERNEQALPQEVLDRLASAKANLEIIVNSFSFKLCSNFNPIPVIDVDCPRGVLVKAELI